MTIRTSCSACGVKLKVEGHLEGRTVRCPGCQQPIEIPRTEVHEEILDPFAEDAEALVSPPTSPPITKPPVPERKLTTPKRKAVPVVDQVSSTTPSSPLPGKPVSPEKSSLPEKDFEPPVEEEFDPGEFPNLSDDELYGEVISPPRRKKKPQPDKKSLVSEPPDSVNHSPRRSKSSAIASASNAGWRWHLHWVLLVALLPLVLSPVLGSKESLEDRISQTIEKHPEVNPEVLGTESSLNELARQLPDQRIDGAWLAADTHWHWGMALVSGGVFFSLLLWMWPDGEPRGRMLMTTGIATGTVGILLLLGVQWVALQTDGVFLRGRGVAIVLFYIVKFIGFSYRCAMDNSSGFAQSFVGYTLGVGLCEELCKALPVVIYLQSDPRKLKLRTACLIGLASGVGFGVSEGITYAIDYYNGIMDFWIYLIRFASCVSLHAIWAGGVAILISTNPDYHDFSWGDAIGFVAFYLSPAMILHGLYNTLLTHQYDSGAIVCAVASFVWLQWLLWRHASEA